MYLKSWIVHTLHPVKVEVVSQRQDKIDGILVCEFGHLHRNRHLYRCCIWEVWYAAKIPEGQKIDAVLCLPCLRNKYEHCS